MTDSSSKLMIPHGDGWASVPPEPERFTKGRVVKFRDGAYFINRNEPILADERQLIVTCVTVAWVRWEDGRPVEHRITGPHQRHPEREKLSHRDESEWPIGFGDKPADVWRDSRYIYLLDPKTAEEYSFVTETYGGPQCRNTDDVPPGHQGRRTSIGKEEIRQRNGQIDVTALSRCREQQATFLTIPIRSSPSTALTIPKSSSGRPLA